MAIDPIASRIPSATTTKSPAKPGIETGAAKVQAKPNNDRIEITANSGQIKRALDTAASLPVVDNERVASIKQALAEGTYAIDPERIAQKISQFELLSTEDSP
ncbi:flagellar biosynthesis anti-sigma factor FlgM [Methylotuvimicrobium alcaliphilum]|uniref:Negative regulator of flagellin synthesis n=1 Tax=Methylotuvimicrobium alcaliphilum (strain DSM 19304 / NCIMB 14124 / VKM B-2133 / 20Z) TaxID=1091494 RepID=G4T3Y1_META2|nr:flagellar biosynthesis anti-sigma factor FlgM [Methylotuvimicrobium alcaliphilum]CCE22680.1 Anti-sigma-28 factor, FlgM [Methylotuvimicrobium alcaliphilum 20Z]